jgi:hypothetical protein
MMNERMKSDWSIQLVVKSTSTILSHEPSFEEMFQQVASETQLYGGFAGCPLAESTRTATASIYHTCHILYVVPQFISMSTFTGEEIERLSVAQEHTVPKEELEFEPMPAYLTACLLCTTPLWGGPQL